MVRRVDPEMANRVDYISTFDVPAHDMIPDHLGWNPTMNGCSLNNKSGSESSTDFGTHGPTINLSLPNEVHDEYSKVAGNISTSHVPAYDMIAHLSAWDPTMTGGQTMEPS